MKKIVSAVATAALVSTSVMAFEPDMDKMYFSAGLAVEDVGLSDNGIALVLGAGIPVMQIDEQSSVALEGELTHSIVSSEEDLGWWGKVKADFMSLGVYGAYTYNVTPEFFVKPRIGLIYKSIDVSVAGGSGSDSEIGLAYGLQGGYNVSEDLAIVAGYNFLDGSDITHLTIGAQLRF